METPVSNNNTYTVNDKDITEPPKKWFGFRPTSEQNLFIGFFIYTLVGTLLLYLPFSQKVPVSLLDCIFMATSAISTTGLVTVSLYDSYTLFGQIIIMLLVQIGGIGYMTFSSFVILATADKLSRFRVRVLSTEFTMPKEFNLNDFVRSVIIFTVIIEAIGAILFFIAFLMAGVPLDFAVWSAIFHSVSSFCTAGFGLYNNSFENYPTHYFINFIIIALSYLGSIGFIVMLDLWKRARGKIAHITFTSKIILIITLALTVFGTLIIYIAEPSLQKYNVIDGLLIAWFQTMSAFTTVGFNTIPLGNMTTGILLTLTFLMYVGASPSGTGGGLKSTTFTAVISVVYSKFIGSEKVQFLGREIPTQRVSVAVATFIFYTSLVFLGMYVLSFTEPKASLPHILFEVASALGTVGLSAGLTGGLSALGKMMIIFLMFVGRLGVITFGIALFERRKNVVEMEDIRKDDLAV